MRSKSAVKPGDLIEIKSGESSLVAKVIYVSAIYKDVMALVPQGRPGKDAVIYTSARAVGSIWPLVGHESVTPMEIKLTRRIVADKIFVADEEVGIASDKDFKSLQHMDVAGVRVVERWARRQTTK